MLHNYLIKFSNFYFKTKTFLAYGRKFYFRSGDKADEYSLVKECESVGAFYPYDLFIVTSAMARWVIGGIVRYNFVSINPKDDIARPYFEVD
jgi:hypothetical protein